MGDLPESGMNLESRDSLPTTVSSHSAEETHALGRAFAAHLQPGDVVVLSGDLGAGKTQFAQGVAAGLGVAEVPISPTFNIVITYESGCMPLHHFDLYRLDSAAQLEDLGIAEYLESGGVCLVEWAEKFPGAFEATFAVDIAKASDRGRVISIERTHVENAARGDVAVQGELDGSAGTLRREGDESVAFDTRVPKDGQAADGRYVLAFDTANEVVALGVGELLEDNRRVRVVATREIAAHRASNTTLVPAVDRLLGDLGITRGQIACISVGRGPGSFTGVRICMAAAKGMAQALGVGLVGVSTLDAVAWNAQAHGVRGDVLVVADAMRKEVYPVRYRLADEGIERLTADCVVKAVDHAGGLGDSGICAKDIPNSSSDACDVRERRATLQIIGDALVKYRALYEVAGEVLSDKLWEVTGSGLLLALEAAWRAGVAHPLDAVSHDPASVLPVYTRLSDAEENERAKLARDDEKNLRTGVQDVVSPLARVHSGHSSRQAYDLPGALVAPHAHGASASPKMQPSEYRALDALASDGFPESPACPDGGKGRATMHSQAHLAARPGADGVAYHPLDARHVAEVAALERKTMGTDAWNEKLVAEELNQRNRTWWVADHAGSLVGYAGVLVVDGDAQVLKIATDTSWRRRGIARELLQRVAEDARNLGASTCSLEVRKGNEGAQAFYRSLGLEAVGVRPRYYSDREDAVIMQGPLPAKTHGVAGMELQHLESAPSSPHKNPLILAIESSCDETAAAVVDGEGTLLSDVVASQIDFHARFGGVVPEIASRKHIEAICGVCAEALDSAGETFPGGGAVKRDERGVCDADGEPARSSAGVSWSDLSAIAVTYAPGLLGALVVGVAFAKGAAWALDVPFIGVNHLEGHLYANKIGMPDFEPPAVVSLVSGGNTMLVYMRGWGDYEVLGETIDDAVGEAFDKVAKALGLGYPGGPAISRQAALGRPDAIAFPRAMMHSHDLRFSLSGLKTAVMNYINDERAAGRELCIPDVAASFQQAVIDVQVAKARTALTQTGARTFCLGGGVAANPALRAAYEGLCARMGVRLVMPPLSSCGDNAGMIALVALDRFHAGKFFPLNADAQAHANLADPY